MQSILEVAKLDIINRNSDLFIQQILFIFLLFAYWVSLNMVVNLTKKISALKELTF